MPCAIRAAVCTRRHCSARRLASSRSGAIPRVARRAGDSYVGAHAGDIFDGTCVMGLGIKDDDSRNALLHKEA